MTKVLLVDDSKIMRRLLRCSLTMVGLNEEGFMEAADGKEALEQLESVDFDVDLIFCDLCMPNMDGIEFLDELAKRQVLESCPVIIVSGDAKEARADEALSHGASKLLPKPFQPAVLAEILEEVVGSSSQSS